VTAQSALGLPLVPTAQTNRFFGDLIAVQRLGLYGLFEERSKLGDIFALDFGAIRPVVLTQPEHIKHVVQDRRDDYPKGSSVNNFRLIVGNGLFTADGEAWKAHRTLLQPSFRKTAVEGYGTQMMHAIEATEARWEAAAGTQVDMIVEMMELALDVVGRTMFSKPITDGRHNLAYHYKRALEEIEDREHSISFPMWVPTPSNLRLRRHKTAIDAYITKAMADRRADGTHPGDLLDALLSASAKNVEGGLDEQQIIDEVATILIAGHETSAIALAFAFRFLALNPHVTERVHEELDRVLGDRRPTAKDVPSLPYMRAMLDETMRLHPPVWIFPRVATADDTIGGYRIPAGTMILIAPYYTHRLAKYWPDPERFEPERFIREPSPDRFAFLPFGAGSRTCAGLAFAYQELVLAMAVLLRKFSPKPTSSKPPTLLAVGTLQTKEGMPMILARR
jgi:cytochrome P450